MVPRWVSYTLMSLSFTSLGIGCGEPAEIEPEVPVEETIDPSAEREQMMQDRQSQGIP